MSYFEILLQSDCRYSRGIGCCGIGRSWDRLNWGPEGQESRGRGAAMFWSALEELHRWERANLPGAASPVGNEVLLWLLKCRTKPRPLKDLYRSSRFSEPTIRNCLR